MDRLTGKDAKLMMEALASVYVKEEVDQEVISEEVEELDENRQNRARAIRAKREAEAAEQDRLYRAGGGDAKRQETRQMQGASRARVRRPGMTRDQVIELGRKNLAAKASTSTGTAPAAPANNAVASKAPAPKPAANPNVTAGGTKFERRLPTMAELRAAQQARRDAPKVLSRSEIENRAVKAGVNAGKPATAVGSAAKPAAAAAKPATAVGSAGSPAAQAAAGGIRNPMKGRFTVDDKVSGTSNTYKPGQKMSAADSSLVKDAQSQIRAGGATAVGSAAAKPAGKPIPTSEPKLRPSAPVVKKPTYNSGRQRARMEEVDIFDTIKEYLIGEGATEEEALKQMLTLTDEQRTEIIEGSCGSKKKRPSKKKGY